MVGIIYLVINHLLELLRCVLNALSDVVPGLLVNFVVIRLFIISVGLNLF
jgi:hypothetical protein